MIFENEKIEQLIPCARPLYADGVDADGEKYQHFVVGFALVVDKFDNQDVAPLAIDGAGAVYDARCMTITEGGAAEREATNVSA